MPVFIHLSILVVDKKSLDKKYKGGIEEFRKSYRWGDDSNHQEDDELFAIASMNSDEQDIEELTSLGLSFDSQLQKSDDFTIVNRYGGAEWPVSWLIHDSTFAWHVEADESLIKKAKAVENMNMDEIGALMDADNNPFKTIRSF